jgi:hypothetical protein
VIVEQPLTACMVMPNLQNPLGFQMSNERKRALVDLLAGQGISVIENDVYNEPYYSEHHPTSLKSCDDKGRGLHCASFSVRRVRPDGRLMAVLISFDQWGSIPMIVSMFKSYLG